MRIVLGQVGVSSGGLAVVDFSLLRAWQAATHGPQARARATGGGLVDFGAGLAAVVQGLPNGTLQVAGTRGADGRTWRFIDVLSGKTDPVAQVDELGQVPVQGARLLFADLTALDRWQADRSSDGLADVAFWGRDAETLAGEVQAGRLPEGVFGWEGMPEDQARQWAEWLEAQKPARNLMMMVDYRPHDHAHTLLSQIRQSPYEIGHLDLGGGHAFGFMTSWGDGYFPVLAMRNARGELLGLRVDLARDGAADVRATGVPFTATGMGEIKTPNQAAADALGNAAVNMAKNTARRAVVRQIKGYLPKFLWPLIPGEGGTVGEALEKEAKKKVSNALWGCGCTAAVFAFLALLLIPIAIFTAWKVWATMPH
jgi:hypothetical protein